MRLHYVYDPLCGWCYAVKPLIEATNGIVEIVVHGGGMLTGDDRRHMTPRFRDYLVKNDRIIATATGQIFGAAYREGLLEDPQVVYDSEPPTAAILAAERLAGRGLEMLGTLQTAHYREGRRISEQEVLVDIASLMGFERHAFESTLNETIGEPVHTHFAESRAFMPEVGGSGFPTFLLERHGGFQRLEYDANLGRPQAWAESLAAARSLTRSRTA